MIAVRASVGLQAYGAAVLSPKADWAKISGDHIELLIQHADAKMSLGAKRVRADCQSSLGVARSAGAANAD